jgi:hypothetical protein
MTLPHQRQRDGKPAPLKDALEKNKEASEEIKDAAGDLVVVHTVLDKELRKDTLSSDAAEAVAQTQQIEKRLSKSAEKLDGVNETLQREAVARTS